MTGSIAQLNISRGGVPKLAVVVAEVGPEGIAGDGHNDRANHGGPERALCLFAIERIEALRAEGHPIAPGTAGENVTIRGIDWDAIGAGARLQLGEGVVIEITRPTTPCKNIAPSFAGGDFNRIHHNLHPGWSRFYARVIEGGLIRPGDAVMLLTAP